MDQVKEIKAEVEKIETPEPEVTDTETVPPHVDLFNAVVDEKPHDAKVAVDTILTDKLSDVLSGYKQYAASVMFNPDAEVAEPEEAPEENPAEVDEMLRATGKPDQSVKSDKLPKQKRK